MKTIHWLPVIAFSTIAIGSLFFRKGLSENSWVYEGSPDELASTNIQLKNRSDFFYFHELNHPLEDDLVGNSFEYARLFLGMMPTAVVADFDRDGDMDILAAHLKDHGSLIILENHNQVFRPRKLEGNLEALNDIKGISSLAAADWDGDGSLEIVIGRWGCPLALDHLDNFEFRMRSRAFPKSTCQATHSVNFLDFDLDGDLDLVFGFFTEGRRFLDPTIGQRLNDKERGARNLLLENVEKDGWIEHQTWFKDFDFTHAVGVADVNNDRFPDILVTNDYSTDQFFLNDEGRGFLNQTEQWIPTREHGLAGMNAEMKDFDGDGLIDIYITNIYRYPFNSSGNKLWLNRGDHFVEESKKFGVSKCGWSWGAKMVDLDLDGHDEIISSNGRFRQYHVDEKKAKSYWYQRASERATPPFLRSFYREAILNRSLSRLNFSGFERPCLYQKGKEESYQDVAINSGINHNYPERGIILIDFNNDGMKDLLFLGFGSPWSLYENSTVRKSAWIGFSFPDDESAHQLKATLFQNNKIISVQTYAPMNGFRGRNDPRIVFPLKPGTDYEIAFELRDGTAIRRVIKVQDHNQYHQIIFKRKIHVGKN